MGFVVDFRFGILVGFLVVNLPSRWNRLGGDLGTSLTHPILGTSLTHPILGTRTHPSELFRLKYFKHERCSTTDPRFGCDGLIAATGILPHQRYVQDLDRISFCRAADLVNRFRTLTKGFKTHLLNADFLSSATLAEVYR
jgi:hypothetical protein